MRNFLKGPLPLLLLALVFLLYAAFSFRSLAYSDQLDLYVYRLGAKLALEGQTPYDTPRFQAVIAERFSGDDDETFRTNCGFFLPPQAIAMFAPLAVLGWDAAQVVWWIVLTACAIGTATLAWTFGRDERRRGLGWPFIIIVVLLNPLTLPSLVVGQTTLLVVASIAIGQLCFERGRPTVGCLLWSLSFLKPHLAILFLAVPLVQGGWKRAAGIVMLVGLWNLAGGLILRRDPAGAVKLLPEYLDYLATAHKAVIFNQVEQNYQIPSWNRLLFVVGGPTINLRISMVLAGYALWAALIAVRNGRHAMRDPAYLLAAAAVGTLEFAQVLAYEMLLLVLVTPWLLQLLDEGRQAAAYSLIGLLLLALVPMTTMANVANGWGLADDSQGRQLLLSHKCIAMAGLMLQLLLAGARRADQSVGLPLPVHGNDR